MRSHHESWLIMTCHCEKLSHIDFDSKNVKGLVLHFFLTKNFKSSLNSQYSYDISKYT